MGDEKLLGKQTVVKRTWTTEECAAVERHLKKFILMNQVPGKDCQRCITAEPQALKSQDWRAVKYFVMYFTYFVMFFIMFYVIMLCSYQHKELLDCFPVIKAHCNNQQLIHVQQMIVF